ncbi:NACHT domain-containing NTPase [Nostoc spongiaeforme FACHB-130]|uniref:NACHT domain-containing NTPase n=1 Tax=Nostoc spongiaeforme FACHB-130 TaxID=1357510 RepID=A0ABR8FYP0_9NOSO|nr:NACHT domain-containing NTPase [Nostoc spongiaeforme]MBD2595392.1 NACHT domain-containing NTPase [Nostoc spongiaeforme FACHB-130]
MTSQGLRASSEGIRAAKTALTDKTLSQHKLAIALGITRQPVSKFFAGEPVSRSCFVQICQHLGLSWQKIADLPEDIISDTSAKFPTNKRDLNILVQEIRQKRQGKIQDQCSTLQMMDIAQTIPLLDIYTPIYVLEKITSQRWLEIDDLLQECGGELSCNQKKLPILETVSFYSKLMILGKPGIGKTTLLKYLALECNQGEFQPNCAAIFISLKDFAEDLKDNSDFSFLKYISQEFVSCGIEAESTPNILTEGRALILLDGLDEVPAEDIKQVNQEIRRFSQIYYKNRFVISCRIGAQKYKFPGFTEVEIADFDIQQAETFVKQWFVAVAHESKEDGESIGNLFIHQLHLPENKQLQELAIAPILLHLICLCFHTKSEFTFKVTKLYEQALNILLGRWDEVRSIQRQSITENFKLFNPKKLLAQIAAITFEQEDYFFEQEQIQLLIYQYLSKCNSYVTSNLELVNQQLQDSEKWLKIIEVEYGLLVERSRGIYSFSHLALQEYLTAKNFVINYQEQSVNQLITHITEKRWQNVLLLTVCMLPNAESMLRLMKQKIDALVANDQKIQDFLLWLNQKSNSVTTQYKAGAIRAFYLVCVGRALEVCLQTSNQVFGNSSSYGLERAMLGNLAFNPELAIDEFLTSTFACAGELEFACHYILNDAIVFDYAHALNIAFDKALNLVVESKFRQFLYNLKKQLPHTQNHPHKFRKWWIEHGKFWSRKFRELLVQYRNICHDWQFSKQQIELMQQYYSANKLLINCLNASQKIAPAIREEIEETLLLGIAEIKN